MSLLAILMPFIIPMVVELCKQAMGHLIGKLPAQSIPILAAALGAASSALPGSPIADPGTGMLAGMAGVAVHQVFGQPKR